MINRFGVCGAFVRLCFLCMQLHSHCGKILTKTFFLSPVRVTSILKGHGEPFVLHMLSQYFTNAASAANHWLQFWAATHQFRSPKCVHENEASAWSHLLGGWPLLLDGADGKLCTQSSKGIQATAVAAQENWLETILVAKRYWLLKYWLLHDGNGCKYAACSILWFILLMVFSQGSSGMRTQPTIDLNIRRCTTSNLCRNLCVSGSEAKPNIAVGETVAWNNFNLSLRDTCLFNNINLCWWNLAQVGSSCSARDSYCGSCSR